MLDCALTKGYSLFPLCKMETYWIPDWGSFARNNMKCDLLCNPCSCWDQGGQVGKHLLCENECKFKTYEFLNQCLEFATVA